MTTSIYSFFNSCAEGLHSAYSSGYEYANAVVQVAMPWQPAIAMTTILGRVGWQAYSVASTKRSIKDLDKAICVLKALSKSDPTKILALEAMQTKKYNTENQLATLAVSVGQLPCLFYTHPGKNIWGSGHAALNKTAQVSRTARANKENEDTRALVAGVVLGSIVIGGALSSCMELMGMVDSSNPCHVGLTKAAFAINLYESGCLALRTIASKPVQKAIRKVKFVSQLVLCQSLALGSLKTS